MSQLISLRAAASALFTVMIVSMSGSPSRAADAGSWITSWAASPQARWNDELPAPMGIVEAVDNQTIRQTASQRRRQPGPCRDLQ